jgi:hypothetical protein
VPFYKTARMLCMILLVDNSFLAAFFYSAPTSATIVSVIPVSNSCILLWLGLIAIALLSPMLVLTTSR